MKWPGVRSYPTYIMVRGQPWDIKFVRKIPDRRDFKTETVGLMDPSQKILYIKLKEKPIETLRTVIHEALHAIEDEYNIDVTHAVINKFEEGITDILIENLDSIATLIFGMLPPVKGQDTP